ncbi:hypothetical protein FPZ12_019920 [Amycolatopsis acidicola]|uniref:WXG100 family type VII secretion target n=1 Tax=Amycolatopsis acidicola TaxID=2596893 RepID=A0A5N0V3V2_9PSEU|nr:hypothetical protein [Amycolatopsis acidicola]KAA9159636.1 hypothetical protein FPZ12_019920 [Amycolatopsis acidicola]
MTEPGTESGGGNEPVVTPITNANSTTGAGAIDSWHSVATSIDEIKNAHGADAAAIGVEIGVTIVGAVADTAALILDPLAKLTAAGLGWLIEHISFLKEPLDQLAGDPAEIKKLAETLHKTAETLRSAGTDLDSALKSHITTWKGEGYDAFKKEVDTRKGQIDDAGHSVDVAGYVVETTMALVTAVRSLIRDLITTVLGDIIATMLVALAAAVFTFGASIVTGVATCVALAAAQAISFAAKLAKLAGFSGRVVDRLVKLSASIKPLPKTRPGSSHEMADLPAGGTNSTVHDPPTMSGGAGPGSEHGGSGTSTHEDTPGSSGSSTHEDTPNSPASQHDKDDPFDTWLAADNHFNPPRDEHGPGSTTPHEDAPASSASSTHEDTPGSSGSSTHEDTPGSTHDESTSTSGDHADTDTTPAPKPAGSSVFKDQAAKFMQKHEAWLQGASWQKVKWVEEQFKNNEKLKPYYPVIKSMADAKSSKNFVGWVGKDIVNVDKALTDIQMQADQAWSDSGDQWRQEHPDPAAEDPNAGDPNAGQQDPNAPEKQA